MSRPARPALDAQLEVALEVPFAARVPMVALRGRPGLCDWSEEVRGHWCWPSDLAHLGQLPGLEAEVHRVVARLAGGKGHRAPVIAGYSNGGFTVALLMSVSTVAVAGYAVLHGGQVTGTDFTSLPPRPTLLVSAAEDGVHRPRMDALRRSLEAAGWSPAVRVRPGNHWITGEDFRALFDFAAAVRVRP